MIGTPSDRLAVIIPARSEQETIAEVIHDVRFAISPFFNEFLIIVVDDMSCDDTGSRADAAGCDLLLTTETAQPGLASAFRLGVRAGTELGATVFLNIDGDGQYRAKESLALLRDWSYGADLVIGNRLQFKPPWMAVHRYIGNRAFSRLQTLGLASYGVDCQSGFRVFSRSVAERCKIESEFTYTQEQTIQAMRRNYTISSPRVSFMRRKYGDSRLVKSTVDYAMRTFGPTLRSRFEWVPSPSELN